MRLAILLGLLAGLLPDGDDASHFPLVPGSRWVYKTQELRWSLRIGEPGPMKEGPLRTVLCVEGRDGPALRSENALARMIVTREGVYRGSVDAANLILKFPLKKFDDWGGGDRKNGRSRFSNHGQGDIELGGVKYHAWRITEQRALPKGLRSWSRWYAPGIGLVWEDDCEEMDGTVTKRSSILESYNQDAAGK
jgi:hypothetical protein